MTNPGIRGHLKAFRLGSDMMAAMLVTGKELPAATVTHGLPPGAKIEGVLNGEGLDRDILFVVVEHESFDMVELGNNIPEMILTFERTWKELEVKPVKFREFF